MISWMQKNNKFLIVTMWIATISFIFSGAATGWSFGVKNSSIGKVGSVELKRDKISMDYQNLFNQYNQMFQGKFDREQAKRMGLEQQVINAVATQAKILNLAKEFGIIVTDEETGIRLASYPAFQTNGKFDRTVYNTFIQNSPFKQVTFEESLKNQLIIEKTLNMLTADGLDNEYKAFAIAFEIADKIKYSVLSDKDVNVTIDDTKLKEFWETRKEQYKTAKQFTLDIQWTETKDTNVTDKDIEEYYNNNRFNYTDSSGKILPLEDAKSFLTDDVKVKHSKKIAYKRYLKLKKGELEKTETLTLDLNDPKLSPELWAEINKANKGELLKPKVVGNRYASVKIVNVSNPVTKTFDEVKEIITPLYKNNANKEALAKLAEEKLSKIDNSDINVSTFITLKNAETQKLGINKQETSDFVSKLFTSTQEKGIIPIGSKIIVYKIIEQKLIPLNEDNNTKELYENTDKVKKQGFEANLIKELDKMYPTEFYR